MSFRLVPKSVTLNDLKGRNGPYFAYFASFGSFRGLLRGSGWLLTAQPSTDSLPRNVMKYINYKHDGRAVPFVVKNGGLWYQTNLQFMSGYSWFP